MIINYNEYRVKEVKMLRIYRSDLETNKLSQVNEITKGCWINLVSPTEEEIERVTSEIGIDTNFIMASLDNEEQPRIDIEPDKKLIIIDFPYKKISSHHEVIDTVPLAVLIVRDDYIVTTSTINNDILNDFKKEKVKTFSTFKKSRFTIQILHKIAFTYQKYLKQINREMEASEGRLYEATKNKELVKLMNLEKSLVYIVTSLKANATVIEKILKGNILNLYPEDNGLLDDAKIENEQAIEMANIYRNILNSMTNTFGTIISNNLNVIMKFLAGITIVFSIPTMISSFMGMNVPLGEFNNHPLSFFMIVLIALFLSLILAFWLKKKDML